MDYEQIGAMQMRDDIIEVTNPHHWSHKLFEYIYRTTQWRDGFFGKDVTPDHDEHYYKCYLPWCKFKKKVTEFFT